MRAALRNNPLILRELRRFWDAGVLCVHELQ
jgi:hypothetical protein